MGPACLLGREAGRAETPKLFDIVELQDLKSALLCFGLYFSISSLCPEFSLLKRFILCRCMLEVRDLLFEFVGVKWGCN